MQNEDTASQELPNQDGPCQDGPCQDGPCQDGPCQDEPSVEIPAAVVSVDIEADLSEVWKAITTSEGLARWLGQDSVMGDKPGDELYVDDVVTGERKRGQIDEFETNRRLGYTWWPDTSPHRATRVAITLEPCEIGTRVTVVETAPVMSAACAVDTSAQAAQLVAAGSTWAWRTALLLLATQMVASTLVHAVAS